MPAPHDMVDSWLEGDLNGVVVLVRTPTPVREAGKEMMMGLNGGRGGAAPEVQSGEGGEHQE
jgi:hypothetical protein